MAESILFALKSITGWGNFYFERWWVDPPLYAVKVFPCAYLISRATKVPVMLQLAWRRWTGRVAGHWPSEVPQMVWHVSAGQGIRKGQICCLPGQPGQPDLISSIPEIEEQRNCVVVREKKLRLKHKLFLKTSPGSKIQAVGYVLNWGTEDNSRNEWARFADIGGLVCVESDFLVLAIQSSLLFWFVWQ